MAAALPTGVPESSMISDFPLPAAPGRLRSGLLGRRRRADSMMLRQLAAERFLAADQASADFSSPIVVLSPQIHPDPIEWTSDSPAHMLGGGLAFLLRAEITSFLRSAGLGDVLEELDAIEERLVTDKPVTRRHAADGMRRVLVAVADHVYPACAEPYRDRWGDEHRVGAGQPVNRILAFVDAQGRLTTVEQRAFGGELRAMWRAATLEVHGSTELGDAKRDYLRLLKAVALVSRASA
jgi:hypothetical protein